MPPSPATAQALQWRHRRGHYGDSPGIKTIPAAETAGIVFYLGYAPNRCGLLIYDYPVVVTANQWTAGGR